MQGGLQGQSEVKGAQNLISIGLFFVGGAKISENHNSLNIRTPRECELPLNCEHLASRFHMVLVDE